MRRCPVIVSSWIRDECKEEASKSFQSFRQTHLNQEPKETQPLEPKETTQTLSSESLSLESTLTRLEEVVEQLEQGEPSLQEALRLFEEGVRLCGLSNRFLDQAERSVERLLHDSATEEETRVPWDLSPEPPSSK